MAKQGISTKRLAISKANAQTVTVVAAACFISIFCLFASKAVWDQNAYRAKIISAKQKAQTQLSKNVGAYDSLKTSYEEFDGKQVNSIGGNKDGAGDNDGSNSKIILDALPSTYDFPALTSSIEKIMSDRGLKISSITGSDDQLNQQNNTTSSAPETVTIPFTFSIDNANYGSVQLMVTALQQSIRPIVIDTMTISGGNNNMTITVTAHTYYQPAKNLDVTKKAIK